MSTVQDLRMTRHTSNELFNVIRGRHLFKNIFGFHGRYESRILQWGVYYTSSLRGLKITILLGESEGRYRAPCLFFVGEPRDEEDDAGTWRPHTSVGDAQNRMWSIRAARTPNATQTWRTDRSTPAWRYASKPWFLWSLMSITFAEL
jgi:hypothetical protein